MRRSARLAPSRSASAGSSSRRSASRYNGPPRAWIPINVVQSVGGGVFSSTEHFVPVSGARGSKAPSSGVPQRVRSQSQQRRPARALQLSPALGKRRSRASAVSYAEADEADFEDEELQTAELKCELNDRVSFKGVDEGPDGRRVPRSYRGAVTGKIAATTKTSALLSIRFDDGTELHGIRQGDQRIREELAESDYEAHSAQADCYTAIDDDESEDDEMEGDCVGEGDLRLLLS